MQMIDMKRAPKVGGSIGEELEALEDRQKEEECPPVKKTAVNPYWVVLGILGTITALGIYLLN